MRNVRTAEQRVTVTGCNIEVGDCCVRNTTFNNMLARGIKDNHIYGYKDSKKQAIPREFDVPLGFFHSF